MRQFNSELYFITDSTGLDEETFLAKVEEALSGGVTLLQLREKEKSTRGYMDLAEKVHRLTQKYNVPLLIDDRLDVALAIGAEGVHLGREDMPVSVARKLAGEHFIIGATAKTVVQAKEAEKSGADYLGVGAIYPTKTKVKTIITSLETLRDICNSVSIPVNAIGGLNCENIGILKGVPISGICIVSAVMQAENPCMAAKKLHEQLKGLRAQ